MHKQGFPRVLLMFKQRMFIVFFLAGFIAMSVLSPAKAIAQGNLLIYPTRVVFEGQKKMQVINLVNTGKDTAEYLISLTERRMTENGALENITQPDSGQKFADKNIRFFPRSVKLAPNESQVIKVQVIKSNELLPGEYRSHFFFRAVPKEKPLGDKKTKADTSFSIKITPVFGITIPVIIRIGENTTKISLSDLSIETVNDTTTQLKMKFSRTGNMSVYGNIVVNYISPSGSKIQVAIAKGISVYTPNLTRRFQVDLNKKEGVDYHNGNLNVLYSTESGDKIAEGEVLLK